MRALVVENESKMAGLLRRGLQEEGYAMDVAAPGEDGAWLGRERLRRDLLDVMLSDIDGFDVCRRLRATGRWSPILSKAEMAADGRSDRRCARSTISSENSDLTRAVGS